ncbi:TetR/AcrR family transcriptional regulator C-terminal domain-containing protein [Saccharothrix tamanrassetensis]|uniref:TetR/AcrR family transcriptional regulator C-terminal domain-containing protein n=1 Tax=Saccharothrix tamanrassetensis TaxID=1051531 RepID=UPI0035E41890
MSRGPANRIAPIPARPSMSILTMWSGRSCGPTRGRTDRTWRDDLASHARVLRAEYLLHRDGAHVLSGTRLTDPKWSA